MPGEFRPSLPGERRGGRQKGTPNKTDATIKDMVIKALQTVGGAQYLAERAMDQPVAFMALVGRVLPLQVTGEAGGPIHFSFEWAPAQPQQTPAIEADETLEVEWNPVDGC